MEDILTVLADRSPTEGLEHNKILEQLDVRLFEVKELINKLLVQSDEISLFKQRLQNNWQQEKCMPTEEMFDQTKPA